MTLPIFFIVLASVALLLALVALWSSLRYALAAANGATESLDSAELPDRAALIDEKKSLLRAIKDLEYEHAVGKISPEDYQRLDGAYRRRAKEVIGLLEQDLAPYQARAEALLARVAHEAPAKVPVPTASDDEASLRERARALREEADRLERLARAETPKKKPSAKDGEGSAKSDESSAKDDEGSAKSDEGSAKGDEGSAKGDEGSAKDDEGSAKGDEGSAKGDEGSAKGDEGDAQ
ncbi:MAG: hypothetical protein U0353_23655 [Sandaracinus sp.]